MAQIKFDYLTLTSKSPTIRSFCFFLLKHLNQDFTIRLGVLQMGGFPYRGIFVNVGGDSNEFFFGQRFNNNCYDFIITMSDEMSNLFAFDFLKSPNLLKGLWKITRVDLQLTFRYDFRNEDHITGLYISFYRAQRAVEKKNRPVSLDLNEYFARVRVGFGKERRRNSWKVYTSMTKRQIFQGLGVRFEVTIRSSGEYQKALENSKGNIESCNFGIIQRTLLEAAKTALLSKHRKFVKDWPSYLKAHHEQAEGSPLQGPLKAPEEAPNGPRRAGLHPPKASAPERPRGKSRELALVSKALRSLAKMMKQKRLTFSHKQMKYLNKQLSPQNGLHRGAKS